MIRTTYAQLYARRVPDLFLWAGTLTGLIMWPHAVIWGLNLVRGVPKINCQTIIGTKPIYE